MKARAFALGLVWALALAAASLRAEQSTVDSTNGATIEQTETNIARVTAALLYRQHYSHRPLDSELASRFLDRYLDTLDHQHSYFLQSDLDEFEPFRTNINLLTLRGDVSPGFSIFNRFIERAQQRISYVSNLLAADSFDFTASDRFIADRSKLPSPKNIAEAQALWREEVRFEYLQEKLQAPNMKYSGPASADSGASALIRLSRDKGRPLSFEYLPTNLFKENGGKLGSVSIENESNALLRVDAGPDISRFDTKFYSDKGAELGRVVKLANWVDGHRTVLSPHRREGADIVVTLDDAAWISPPAPSRDDRLRLQAQIARYVRRLQSASRFFYRI